MEGTVLRMLFVSPVRTPPPPMVQDDREKELDSKQKSYSGHSEKARIPSTIKRGTDTVKDRVKNGRSRST